MARQSGGLKMPAFDAKPENFTIQNCPIIGPYGVQRFRQWGPEDNANWYIVKEENTKKPYAMYPVMGRAHINVLGFNELIFGTEPRGIFKSVNYAYVVDGDTVYQINSDFQQISIGGISLKTTSGAINFAFLIVGTNVYVAFQDAEAVYIYQEGTANGLQLITDPLAPGSLPGQTSGTPGYIASFGNRFVVSLAGSSEFILSAINLAGTGASNPSGLNFDPAKCFTNSTGQIFAQESGIIRQMGVLNNTLYIFTDYITGVWSNIQSVFSGNNPPTTFPWKKNTTYDWNFGIGNSTSLDIDFGYLVFLARNSDGLLQFMYSQGGQPQRLSTKAIDTLLQKYTNDFGQNNPFLSSNSNGFLFQYEGTIFYRMSGGNYLNNGILDQEQEANSIEYSFEANEWHRCIELNGERNRIQNHVYFNFKHLVTVTGENTVYNMSGQFYYNEVRNAAQDDPQASDAYLAYPFRYERVTPNNYLNDYSEFETEFVQVDFVWGHTNINFSTAPFENTEFIIAEQAVNQQPQYVISETLDDDGQPIFVIADDGNTPQIEESTYNTLLKPAIELFYSDDGGISYFSADVRQFSNIGIYSWRVRWYQLGCSRNRVYKLIAVSPVPIVILGAVMNVRRVSGGAY